MGVNPHSLKPVEIARLMNSTPLGTVVEQTTVYRQQNKAGLRIGNGKQIDLVQYVAWLFLEWRRRLAAESEAGGLSYAEKHRRREAERSRRLSESVRDIGELPEMENPERKESCRWDLAKFIMTYAPEGKDPFSEDHLRVIKRIENAIFHGGRFVEAVYRGFGKSTISELTATWAICYGHKRFIPIIGANQTRASDNLNSIKGIFESDLLLADFPEVCYPIHCLEGINQRSHGQLYRGQPTHIEWSADYLVFPMIPGSEAAGSVILACGITSSKVRGMKKRRGDGVQIRPDFCVIDDPQDEDSSASPQQITKRLNIIQKAIIRSAGHKTGMSVVMPCTVIQKDDLVDQLLDPLKYPAWQGERIPFIRKWADRHDDLWLEQYRRIRTSYNPDDPDDYLRARREATEFYVARRDEMDKGCIVGWSYCFEADKGEVSAIQHAYNALIDDGEAVFAPEFQNEPFLPPEEEGQLTAEEIYARINNLNRGEIPVSCERLTAFIDVQGKVLYYAVVAWGMDFTGYVIDYGTFPDQHRRYFTLRQATKTLQQVFPGTGQEGAWRAGLEKLTGVLLAREWKRDDGVGLRISRCLIDANDGNAAGTVYDFCRQSPHAAIVMPSRGKGVTASSLPFSDYKRKAGDRVSEFNWRIPAPAGRNAVRFIFFDTNYWKSFIRSRLRVAKGDPGAVTVFGKKPEYHRMLTEQLTAEYSVRTEGRGRIVDEWQIRPTRSDNHLFDCLVGCAVAASEQGVVLPGTGGTEAKKKPPIKLSKLQGRA